jgi:hypothetical protein
MKTNTEEFNKYYDNFIIESEELVNTMSYYLNEPLGENDNINEIKTQIDKLKNRKIQNTTHKNMCSILTKLNSYIRNIKKDFINTYDSKTTNKNIKEINKLFVNLQEKKQIDVNNNLQLNLNQIGQPIILGAKDSFPIILTNNISESMPLTQLEGIFKAYNIPSSFLHNFYERKAKRDFKNKNGTMVPYIKMLI